MSRRRTAAMTPDPREEKLPVWVRDTLKDLRRQVETEQGRADEARLSGGPEDTDVLIDAWDDVPVRLPKGQRVRFLVGPEESRRGIDRMRDFIDVHVIPAFQRGDEVLRPARLELYGGGSLVLRSSSSNVATATVE